MTEKSVTQKDLTEAVYQKGGLTRSESTAFVELVLKEIAGALEKGETVKLSSFGSVMVRKKGRRIGSGQSAEAEVAISPRRVMVFEPSAILEQGIGRSGGADAANEQPLESETQIAALIETIAGALKSTAS
jgi:integration host factor subunit alpha